MDKNQRQEHWDTVYREKSPEETSWYQVDPAPSLAMIDRANPGLHAPLIDVGGGASTLVDALVQRGFERPSVLDISAQALEFARARLAPGAPVTWIVADITVFRPGIRYALWHDRAVFHFLTDSRDRALYVAVLRASLLPGGHLVLGTFAMNGPARCSGLEVVRYDAPSLGRELGDDFILMEQVPHTHMTPWGSEQQFVFFRYIYRPAR